MASEQGAPVTWWRRRTHTLNVGGEATISVPLCYNYGESLRSSAQPPAPRRIQSADDEVTISGRRSVCRAPVQGLKLDPTRCRWALGGAELTAAAAVCTTIRQEEQQHRTIRWAGVVTVRPDYAAESSIRTFAVREHARPSRFRATFRRLIECAGSAEDGKPECGLDATTCRRCWRARAEHSKCTLKATAAHPGDASCPTVAKCRAVWKTTAITFRTARAVSCQ